MIAKEYIEVNQLQTLKEVTMSNLRALDFHKKLCRSGANKDTQNYIYFNV